MEGEIGAEHIVIASRYEVMAVGSSIAFLMVSLTFFFLLLPFSMSLVELYVSRSACPLRAFGI